jgi:membrane-bound ClpP family serine protease
MTADILIILLLASLGILMFLTEIFLLPGVTVAAVAGVTFSIGSIYYAYTRLGLVGGHITIVVSVVVFGFLLVWLIRSRAINKISLTTGIDARVDTSEMNDIQTGDEGVAVSRLNPIGKVRIKDRFVEAKSLSGFIDDGTTIVVVEKLAGQVLVAVKQQSQIINNPKV